MKTLNDLPKTYDDAVEILATWHGDEGIVIYHSPDPDSKVVRLVEVSNHFADDDELRPVTMGASVDFPFPSSVLLLSKADWEQVQRGTKSLPVGWDKSQLTPVLPHE